MPAPVVVDIRERRNPGKTADFTPIDAVCREALATIQEQMGGSPAGIHTGIPELHRALGPLRPGCLYLLAGTVGTGAHATAFRLARSVAACPTTAQRTLVVSLVEDRIAWSLRMLTAMADADHLAMDHGRLSAPDHTRLAEAAQSVSAWPLEVIDPLALTMDQVMSIVKQRSHQSVVKLLIIDDLRLITGPAEAQREPERLSAIERELKILALDLGIAVLAVVHIPDHHAEPDGPSTSCLADLARSGPSGRAADVVMILNRVETVWAEGRTDLRHLRLTIAQNRFGPSAQIGLRYWPSSWRIDVENGRHTDSVTDSRIS
jgi:replicative DNA helicase